MSVTFGCGAQVEFGSILVGSVTRQELSVANSTGAVRTLEVFGPDAGAFHIESGASVPAGATGHAVAIRFAAGEQRALIAYLRDTGATGAADPRVTLTGVGVAPMTYDAEDSDKDGKLELDEVSRFRIHVPFTNTTLVMGRGATDPATYDGFGVRTDERFFVNALKNVVMQSSGHSIYKAVGEKSNLYAIAGNDAVVGGVNSANMLAGDSVLIAGGLGGFHTRLELGDRATYYETDKSDGADNVKENRQNVATSFLVFDALLGVTVAGVTIAQTVRSLRKDGISQTKWKKAFGYGAVAAGVLSGAAGIGLSTAGAARAPGVGGTTIFGSSGVLIGSFGFNISYSLAGIAHAAPFVSAMGIDVSTVGLHSVAVQAVLGSISMYGRQKVGIHSTKAVRLTSGNEQMPDGEISINAGKVTIGAPDDKCASIALHVGSPVKSSQIKVANGIEANSDFQIDFDVSKGRSRISINEWKVLLNVAPAEFLVNHDLIKALAKEIVLASASGNELKVAADGVAIKSAAEVKITGQKVSIM